MAMDAPACVWPWTERRTPGQCEGQGFWAVVGEEEARARCSGMGGRRWRNGEERVAGDPRAHPGPLGASVVGKPREDDHGEDPAAPRPCGWEGRRRADSTPATRGRMAMGRSGGWSARGQLGRGGEVVGGGSAAATPAGRGRRWYAGAGWWRVGGVGWLGAEIGRAHV